MVLRGEKMIHEHIGDNRSGKTFVNALFAWEAYNQGRDIYCNCPDGNNGPICILNFPHRHVDMDVIQHYDLVNCYVMTDESVETMDARKAMKNSVREIGFFGYQATKRGVDWHYDAVRHKNIDPRVRLNPHFIIESFRIPRNPKLPLVAIKLEIQYRYAPGVKRKMWFHRPSDFFPIYNHFVRVPSKDN